MSVARTAKRYWRSIDPVLRALMISILVHLIVFGSWKTATELGLTKKLQLFSFLNKATDKLMPVPNIAVVPPPQQEREIELTFVEVDPAKLAEEPKETKFYGAVNTEAANEKVEKDTEIPKIEGVREEARKLTENLRNKAQPLQPTPAPPAEFDKEEKEAVKPKQTEKEGDTRMAKAAEKPRKDDGTADVEIVKEEQPRQRRPRTLAEARATQGSPGEKTKTDGGVKRYDLSGSFAVKGSVIGSYDQRFIEAVRQCWYDMLDNISAAKPGKVRLEFRINHKGQISDVRVAESSVSELQTVICQQAIEKPAPYGDWPREMRLELKGDYRDVTFTFTYH